MSHVTTKRLEFLGHTADSLVEVASSMTNENCQGKVMSLFPLGHMLIANALEPA